MATVKVRQLAAVGTRKNDQGEYVANEVGDEYALEDLLLDRNFVQPGGPSTLVDLYVAAGYVEIVK